MVNRYSGEIRINPVAILRKDDFNNEGGLEDIDEVLSQAIEISKTISDRLQKLKAHLKAKGFSQNLKFNFSEGGYIAMKGCSDGELLEMKSKGLIDLYDLAADKEWVKKYGAQFGLVWENGRAVVI